MWVLVLIKKAMVSGNSAFDDFLDDCFIKEDPLCNFSNDNPLKIVDSKLVSELLKEDYEPIAS